jgi:cytochrome P450
MSESPVPVPVVRLDPLATDHHGEAAHLRELGPVVRAVLPGEVHAWVVTEHALLAELVADPRVSKDWRNWTSLQRGEIPADWPLLGMVRVTNMVTADGAQHQRLRKPVVRAFTRNRVEGMRPRIESVVEELVADLPARAERGAVDLRPHFAHPVPMRVICELVGVPEGWQARLRELVDSLFRTDTTADQARATQRERHALLNELVELRRREPGEDLTSALVAANAQDSDALTDEELVDTLWLLLTAGHETTLSLIVNGVRALLVRPEHPRPAREDADGWSRIVEEVLRWDAPIGNFLARYPSEDLEIAGVTIPRGAAILAPYSGVGRDPAQHGDNAHEFEPSRQQNRHLAFGGGPHVCLGAHLARLEGVVALSALFDRYPDLELAAEAAELAPVPSLFSNSAASLPVRLNR